MTGGVASFTVTDPGTGIEDATYTERPLTGGTGSDATADLVVSGGTVTSFTPATAGTGYEVGQELTTTLPGADVVTPGTGEALTASYTGGTGLDASDGVVSVLASEGVTSAGNNGVDAEFDITISGGEVTAVAITAGGTGYEAGDAITFDPTVVLGSTIGDNLEVTIDTVDEDTTAPGQAVVVTATVASIS